MSIFRRQTLSSHSHPSPLKVPLTVVLGENPSSPCATLPPSTMRLLQRRPKMTLSQPRFQLRLSQETALDNHDLKPVPPAKRTWRAIDWVSYWISDQFAPATWQLGASMAATGVTARAAIPCVFFGFLCVGFVMWAAGVIGATYHVAFPVINRAPWGIYGSLFPVAARAFLALMWLSILTVTGGNLTEQLLISLSPRFAHMPNHLPESANITSRGLLCFFVYWIVQTPITMIPVARLKYFFRFKAIVCPPAFLAIGIWALVKTHGGGLLVRGPVTAGAWPIIAALNAATTIYCTVAVNIADFTRFSRSARGTWQQVVLLPITGTIPCACGFFAADAALKLYGEAAWDPAKLIALWGSRPATFFGALVFLIATVGVNISANAISFATDAMSVWPAYVDIRRGCAIAAVLAVAITPWNLVNSAQGFLNFLGAYGCWLGPVSGIMLVDYYLLRRQKLDVRQLYVHPRGMYSYVHGVNPRAYLAFLVAFVPNFPGFINAINPAVGVNVPIYHFNWYFGIVVGAAVYGVLCKYVWPLPKVSLVDEAVYPDEAYFWPDDESASSIDKDVDAEKTAGSGNVAMGTATTEGGSLDGMQIDTVLGKAQHK
ncbi:related to Uracil permease [Sporisorium reilianum SRZ2]|uniref:Related to Uracil permease n=1 Tax=Sporisorium reilianum (strain SRZ2) TaxID=999809 RepID=E6ZPM8_SPORE|nr:related to Uracil permease [Sporisorium reilianum SRZ2]